MEKIKEYFSQAVQFLKEARGELRKVTWPAPKDTMASTSVVIVLVLVVSLFLGMVDLGLTRIIRLVLG